MKNFNFIPSVLKIVAKFNLIVWFNVWLYVFDSFIDTSNYYVKTIYIKVEFWKCLDNKKEKILKIKHNIEY